MKILILCCVLAVAGVGFAYNDAEEENDVDASSESAIDELLEFTVSPIGYVREIDDKTYIVLDEKYEDGLLRMEHQEEIWVLWWFDKNDTQEKRSILQVHPRGNSDNPLTGVFATHSPVRPNLIAMTKCKIISVDGCRIEIDGIDAFPDTPVLDIKSG